VKTFSQLASNQQQIWHDQHAHPKSPLYNIGGTLILSGQVNYNYLNKAIQHLVDENDAFRITVGSRLAPKQHLLKKVHFELEFIDFSDDSNPQVKAHQWLSHNFQQPFSFKKNSLLWHFALIKESENRYYLMTKYHHLIADGWSTTVVIARLAEIYNALLHKKAIDLKSTPHYFDFIKREQEYLSSVSYQTDKRYWYQTLPTAPEQLISRQYPMSSDTVLPKAHSYQFTISRTLYSLVSQFASDNKYTSYQVFLSALAIYYSRTKQRNDIVIGVPSLNRKGARFKDTFGMFISLSPLVLKISATETFSQVTANCKTSLRNLYRHQRFPLNDISKRLNLLSHGRDTVFDIVLSYEKHQYSSTYGTASIRAKQQFSGVARYPLAITICDFSDNGDIEVFFEGAENCFTVTDLQFLAERFLSILQQICNDPQKTIVKTSLLTAQDKNIIFEQFNRKKNQSTVYPTVIQLFQQCVNNHPEKIALEFKKTSLSYHQLDKLSTQLAEHILCQGIQADDVVALCLPQCPEIIIGIIAILKASATYLPISADNPNARIKSILQQGQARLLLTCKNFQTRLENVHHQLICIDGYQSSDNTVKLQNISTRSNSLAYIIFTSGSSGHPKGIMIGHEALSSRIHWLQSLFKLSLKDRMGQTIHYTFDPSIIEIFLSLTQGASLILRPEENRTAESFAQFIIDQKISSLALVPSSVRLLLQGLSKAKQNTVLRVACCGGEPLPPALAKQFIKKTRATLFNVYGPTEATIAASAWQCTHHFSGQTLPIGRPANDTSIYIMDKNLNFQPVNVEGEIVISGITLARGYINQPELGKPFFATSAADSKKPSALYKTGDKGYIGYDGLLYFSGRIDRQVKISGYRIELGEIESVLQSHPAVKTAAATISTVNEKGTICAYIETNDKNTEILLKELSLLLRQQLPSYMQAKIIPLKEIKVDQAGKIDYSQLPAPCSSTSLNQEKMPASALEIQLHSLWKKVLSTKTVGIHQNFFSLGGDSISAISLMIAIEQLTNTRYPLSFLLRHPTIAEQAAKLETIQPSSDLSVLNTLSNHPAPTIFIAASGHGDFIRLSNLANTLGDSCSVHMLQPSNRKIPELSIHNIAQSYADSIMQKNSRKPFYIAGFSIGGITALETAKILLEKGTGPKGLILFDSVYPRWPLKSPALFKYIKYTAKALRFDKMIVNNRKLGAMMNDHGIQSQLNALPNHKVQSINLPVDLILTKRMWMFHPIMFSTWKKLFKQNLTHHSVSGLHGEMFQPPHCHDLAAIIKRIIKK